MSDVKKLSRQIEDLRNEMVRGIDMLNTKLEDVLTRIRRLETK